MTRKYHPTDVSDKEWVSDPVWVQVAQGKIEQAKQTINAVPGGALDMGI